MGCSYDDMRVWSRLHDVITNRVGVINETMGCRCHHAEGNPCSIAYERGRYRVVLMGREVAAFGLWDVAGADAALARLDGVNDALWLSSALGLLSPWSDVDSRRLALLGIV